jgi:hypothetical protein
MMKKTPKPMAHKENLDIPIEDNQPQGQFTYAKKELRFPTSSTGDVETAKKAKQIEVHAPRHEQSSAPSTPENTEGPKPMKNKIRRPVGTLEPQLERVEHDADLKTAGRIES